MAKRSTAGFTITELMIATTVFAVVLVIAQTMFVQIGHLFYRGVSITNTQDVANHIFQDINGNFQNATGFQSYRNSSAGGYDYYCIGHTRYTYRIDNQVHTDQAATHSATTGNFGIVKDTLHGTGDECAPPCDDVSPTCDNPLNNPVELLGDKMRVEQFNIIQPVSTSNLYNVKIVIAYGDTNALTYRTAGDLSTVSCQGDHNNNFCAVSQINTAVYRGIHQ